ncbi:MAG: hypothetical protein ABJE66_12250 [Deltaproteobacteria bacterium]
MSELFGRMLDRAAGRAQTVRPALVPRVLPGPAISELALETEAPARGAAAPASVHALEAVALPPRSAELHRPASTMTPPAGSVAPQQTAHSLPAPRTENTHDSVIHETIELDASPVSTPATGHPARLDDKAFTPTPILVEAFEVTPVAVPFVAPPFAAPPAPRVVASTRSELVDPMARVRDAEPEPEPPSRRTHAPAPKIDLREALAAVGRAIARPPSPAPAPSSTDQDVHISIGHIEVRAPSPTPAPAPPVRRTPSITLVDYLRRRPGDGR